MNNSIYKITLDMHETTSQVIMNMKKNDSGREIHICFTDSGKPFKMDDGVIATFRAKKPDGTILYNNCHTDADHIVYTLTNQTTSEVGIVECEVTLYSRTRKQITSARFSILVEDILYSDSEVESTDEFTALTEAIVGATNVNAELIGLPEGAEITITDRYGNDNRVIVLDGQKGDRGEPGQDGRDGINGVAVEAPGIFAFNVTQEGILQVSYTGEQEPSFYLGDDGHLYVTLDGEGTGGYNPEGGGGGGTGGTTNYIDLRNKPKINGIELIGNLDLSQFGYAIKTENNNFSSQTINGTLTVNGDIVQNGSAYESHAEKLYTKNDMVITRDGSVGGLGDNEYTGIQAKNYDGANDGILAFGNDGVARVGDVNDTQPILTRSEASELRDGQIFMWDEAQNKAVGTLPVASLNIHSCDETLIGQWNGKPLYRKVFSSLTVPKENTTANFISGLSALNIDTLTKFDGIVYVSDANQRPINLFISTSDYIATWRRSADEIGMKVGTSSYCSKPVTITIEYTKTTDEPQEAMVIYDGSEVAF